MLQLSLTGLISAKCRKNIGVTKAVKTIKIANYCDTAIAAFMENKN